ncbi:MAG TPA: hypothetical protein VLV46_01135 [Gaiellaceae bacterium]|nr:hypothetical protein [Gaiellaceae bacterium]
MIATNGWVVAGTVAAVAAAVAGVGAILVAWFYGHGTSSDARKAVQYERLRDARDLINEMRRTGDNARFVDTNVAGRKLQSVVHALDGRFPATERLAAIEWGQAAWESEGLAAKSDAALDELDEAGRKLA